MVRKEYSSVDRLCEELGGKKRKGGSKCEVHLEDGRRLSIEESGGTVDVSARGKGIHDVEVEGFEVDRSSANEGTRGDVMLQVAYNPKSSEVDLTHEQFWLR